MTLDVGTVEKSGRQAKAEIKTLLSEPGAKFTRL
jgi:hypothetical protein